MRFKLTISADVASDVYVVVAASVKKWAALLCAKAKVVAALVVPPNTTQHQPDLHRPQRVRAP